ncbi:hypothetical protein WR25_19905 [Diploscapter pachys]|uniref:DUF6456 domain-containing protein n=1 Tax=Diploscapter pachys TaxID=2018661 RepID=A0A2A2JWX9_9BILA|nr:hypothetical protein WR25_19905 [Diploscapter pachys]
MASPRDSESEGARDMRELAERTIGDARRVRVNVAESPLGWLKARGMIAAKRRFDAALDAAGKGLSDIAWRTICAGEALPVAEKALGWPVRSGRLVLTLALDRLADHYRLA